MFCAKLGRGVLMFNQLNHSLAFNFYFLNCETPLVDVMYWKEFASFISMNLKVSIELQDECRWISDQDESEVTLKFI